MVVECSMSKYSKVVMHWFHCHVHLLLPAVLTALCLHCLVAVLESSCWRMCICYLCWLFYPGCRLVVVVFNVEERSTDDTGEHDRVGVPSWLARRPEL